MEARDERWESRLLDPGVLRLVARDETDAAEWLEKARWPDGVVCLRCGSRTPYVVGTKGPKRSRRRREWRCTECLYIFTVRRGTFMDGSKSPLTAWCTALLLAIEPEAGDKATALAEATGIQRRTAQRLSEVAAAVVREVQGSSAELEEHSQPPAVTSEPAKVDEGRRRRLAGSVGLGALQVGILLAVVAAVAAWLGSELLSERTTLRAQWASEGVVHALETNRRQGEPRTDWEARHQDRARRLKGLFPPEE